MTPSAIQATVYFYNKPFDNFDNNVGRVFRPAIICLTLLGASYERKTIAAPVPFNDYHSSITVPARMDGQETEFVLDTAAQITGFDEVFTRLRPSLGKSRAWTGQREATEVWLFTGRPIEVGEVFLNPPLVFGANLGPIQTDLGVRIGGLLGKNAFDRSVLALNCESNFVEFADRPMAFILSDTNYFIVPMVDAPETRIDAQLGESITSPLALDTGAEFSVVLNAPDWKRAFPKGLPASVPIRTANFEGTVSHDVLTRLPRLRVGSECYTNLLCACLSNATVPSLLGLGFVRRHNMMFDCVNKRVFLKRLPGETADEWDMSGITTHWERRDHQKLLIKFVDDDGPAKEAGVLKNDQIETINDLDVRTLSPSQLERARTSGDGEMLKLGLVRNSRKISLSVRLKRKI